MLAQVNPLPRAQSQFPLADRDRNAGPEHRRFHVGWHVVGAFDRVNVRQRFRNGVIHSRFKIGPNIGIGVFVDRQRCAGVLDKEVQQPHADRFDFRNLAQDGIGDQVIPPSLGRHADRALNPHLISVLNGFWLAVKSRVPVLGMVTLPAV